MPNYTEIKFVWKYCGFKVGYSDGNACEEWILVMDGRRRVGEARRYSREFLEQTQTMPSPVILANAEFANLFPWSWPSIRRQLDDGAVLFALSDSGTKSVRLDEVCGYESAVRLKRQPDGSLRVVAGR